MRINFIWIILTAILLFWGGLFVYKQIGENTATGSLNNPENQPIRVAVLQSDLQNIPVLDEKPSEPKIKYRETVNRWTRILLQPSIRHTFIDDSTLLDKNFPIAQKYNVLIVPSARMLTVAHQKAIKAFAKAGGGVWMTWATGVYATDKKWQGWDFIEDLMGVKVLSQSNKKSSEKVTPFLLYGKTPFTADIPAGYRLHLGNYHQPVKLALQQPETKIAGSWFVPRLDSLADLNRQVGLVYRQYGAGRLVYMGFEPDVFEAQNRQIGLTDEDELVLKRFFWNGIQWLSKKEIASVSTWKYGYQAAASIGIMSDDAQLRWQPAKQLPFTIYGRTPLKANTQKEVGVWGKSSDMDREEAMQEVRKRLSENAVGIYTDEALNTVVRLILSASGYDYGITKTQEPYWSVPRVLPNRINDFVQIEAPTDSLRQLADAWQTYASGGFLPLYYTERLFQQNPEAKDQVNNLVEALHENQFWVATGKELADWMRTRAKLSAQINAYNPTRSGVQIINNGGAKVDSVALYVYLRKPFDPQKETLTIRPEDVWEISFRGDDGLKEGRDYRFTDAQKTVLQIRIKNLTPFQFRAYQIDRIPKNTPKTPWWQVWK